jgi:hypothetical protein
MQRPSALLSILAAVIERPSRDGSHVLHRGSPAPTSHASSPFRSTGHENSGSLNRTSCNQCSQPVCESKDEWPPENIEIKKPDRPYVLLTATVPNTIDNIGGRSLGIIVALHNNKVEFLPVRMTTRMINIRR